MTALALPSPFLVAGLGCRRNTSLAELLDLLQACLARFPGQSLAAIATHPGKAAALEPLAHRFGVPVFLPPLNTPVPNPSARVSMHLAVPSVAEAAAAWGGPLALAKTRSPNATCALGWWSPTHFAAYSPSAASASATLPTSVAGP